MDFSRRRGNLTRAAFVEHCPSMKVSIVIPVLNRADHIGAALASIRVQGVSDVEVIAVDGGSTDGTQAVIAAAPEARLIDAPGSSIYEALNLGIAASSGAIIGHLNSDDRLAEHALARIQEAAQRNRNAAVIVGLARYVTRDAQGHAQAMPHVDRLAARPLDVRSVVFGVPAINRCFVRRQTYEALGRYDERLRIASDREWILRAVLAKVPIATVDAVVYEYLIHQGSLTMASRHRSEARYAREHLQIAAQYLATRGDEETRRILLRWHGQETIRFLLRSGLADAPVSALGRAFRLSPLWPLYALRPLLDRAGDRLASWQARRRHDPLRMDQA